MRSYILIGTDKKKNDWLNTFKNKLNIPSYNQILYQDKIKIADVRSIQKSLYFKAKEKENRLIIFQNSLTIEAQNALLKTLEELPPHVYIILTGKNIEDFLPTVQSRCKIILFSQNTDLSSSGELEQKLKDFFSSRREFSKSIILVKEIEGLDPSREYILDVLQKSLRTLLLKEAQKGQDANIYFVKQYSKSLQGLLELYPLIVRNNLNLELSLQQVFLNSV